MYKIKFQNGFTFLEVMMVIVLMTITLGFTLLYGQTAQVRNNLSGEVARFVSYVRLAQSDAAAGKNNTAYGIHLATDAYTVFEGTTYDANATTNFTVDLPSTITIENSVLNGGGSDLIFTQPHGETATFGTLDFVSAQINTTKTITITQLGTVNY